MGLKEASTRPYSSRAARELPSKYCQHQQAFPRLELCCTNAFGLIKIYWQAVRICCIPLHVELLVWEHMIPW